MRQRRVRAAWQRYGKMGIILGYLIIISRSPLSTWLPDLTSNCSTTPGRSACTEVSIFMASSASSFCPLMTCSPCLMATPMTMPGMLAATCVASAESALTFLTIDVSSD